ncbi:hypothetical protein KAJ27_09970, partial [bacterium]|nr:hypothetical protein [bacterium]
DQLKHVDDLISDLSKCKKQLKSYLVSFNKKGNTNKNRIIKLEKMEAKNRKILKKARKVIADLSLSKVTEDYYMDRKTQESSKLNDAWVFGKISADEYAELRKKLDDPKKRAEYVRKDLEKQREIISENESVMNRSMIERKKIPQLEDQWNNVKLWTKKYINKINDKMLEMKTIRHELKQKVDSDIH